MSLMNKMAKIIKNDNKSNFKKEAFLGKFFQSGDELDALKEQILSMIPNGSIQDIENLISKGAPTQDPSILSEAILYSRADVVDLLLKNGADTMINSVIEYGMTPLTLLINNVDNNYKEVFRTLIDAGADILLTDDSGNTPLHYAVMKDNSFIISAIITLSNNAQELLNTKNNQQLTPMDIAKNSNNKDLIEHLNIYTKTKNTKGERIDFFDAKVRRLKKKLTPQQYNELKEEYEDLKEENLGENDEGWTLATFKDKFLTLLESWGLVELENEEYDEEDKRK